MHPAVLPHPAAHMAKTGLDARVVVNETLLTSVAGKWFAFAKDIEKKNLGEAYVPHRAHCERIPI